MSLSPPPHHASRVAGVNVALEPNANANGTIGYSISGTLAERPASVSPTAGTTP